MPRSSHHCNWRAVIPVSAITCRDENALSERIAFPDYRMTEKRLKHLRGEMFCVNAKLRWKSETLLTRKVRKRLREDVSAGSPQPIAAPRQACGAHPGGHTKLAAAQARERVNRLAGRRADHRCIAVSASARTS